MKQLFIIVALSSICCLACIREKVDYNKPIVLGAERPEIYSDRKSSGRIARYVQQIAQQYHSEYVRPQESGNHTDLRYMAVKNKDGKYLVLSSDGLTHIHADLTQMGVGGTDTWGSLPLEEYMLTGTDYTFALTLSPKM